MNTFDVNSKVLEKAIEELKSEGINVELVTIEMNHWDGEAVKLVDTGEIITELTYTKYDRGKGSKGDKRDKMILIFWEDVLYIKKMARSLNSRNQEALKKALDYINS